MNESNFINYSNNFKYFFSLNYNFIAKKINIFDYPDNQLKIHKKKTPLLGGLFVIVNIIIIVLFDQLIREILIFEKKRRNIFFFYIHYIFFSNRTL